MNTINLESLSAAINAHPQKPLVFQLGQRSISPGYHVTEVKHASLRSLDCGHGTEQWEEIIVQLLDGSDGSESGYMTGGKFMAIVGKASESLSSDKATPLYFEFAVNNGPIQKLQASSLRVENNELQVELQGFSAVCKPFERAFRSAGKQGNTPTGCCGNQTIDTAENQCCDSSSTQPKNNACCG